MTTVARGLCTSAPEPSDNAIGINPSDATNAVISIGLSLDEVPVMILLWTSDTPFSSSRLKYAIITIPFSTATPNKAMNPTPADILNGKPLITRANIPPTIAKGIPEKTSRLCFTELNVMNSSAKIKTMKRVQLCLIFLLRFQDFWTVLRIQ